MNPSSFCLVSSSTREHYQPDCLHGPTLYKLFKWIMWHDLFQTTRSKVGHLKLPVNQGTTAAALHLQLTIKPVWIVDSELPRQRRPPCIHPGPPP